jgi:hypothetical protein
MMFMALYIFNQEKEFKRTMEIIDIGCHILFGYVQDSVESYFGITVSWLEAMRLCFSPDRIKSVETHLLSL